VQQHGTGALNIDACRIGETVETWPKSRSYPFGGPVTYGSKNAPTEATQAAPAGRWPPNVALDESQAAALDEQSGVRKSGAWDGQRNGTKFDDLYGEFAGARETPREASQGGASRFFYCAKAPKSERPKIDGVSHPTVKPLSLMRWLVRLVTPPGGTVLDPFAGSGTTGEAAILEGFRVTLIEREREYVPLIMVRLARAQGGAS
jgi:site-specific DNA-methyltransferase (adenine-specific)